MGAKFTVQVGGKKYDIPNTMRVLGEGASMSGESIDALVQRSPKSTLVAQGIIFVGLRELGVKKLGDKPLSFDVVGDSISGGEALSNEYKILAALSEDMQIDGTESGDADQKNEVTGEASGDSSSDSLTVSSD